MSILVLQSSRRGRESLLLCLVCLPGVSWWLCGASSRWHGFVCGLRFWYLLIILTYYLFNVGPPSVLQMAFRWRADVSQLIVVLGSFLPSSTFFFCFFVFCLFSFTMQHQLVVINEPVHEISNNVVCATSKAPDQPAHTRSLIGAFASRLSIIWLISYWLNTIWSV